MTRARRTLSPLSILARMAIVSMGMTMAYRLLYGTVRQRLGGELTRKLPLETLDF